MLLLDISELLGGGGSDELCGTSLEEAERSQVSRGQGQSCSHSYVTRRSSLHVMIIISP